jgi:hypothetical protein
MKLKKFALRGIAGVLVAAALLYAGDYLSLRFRIPRNRPQFSQIQVQPYYAIAEKNNKTEFLSADPQLVTCAHSIFPQMGYKPCWYVQRNINQRIDE